MAVQLHSWRKVARTAAVLFLPAACVLAVGYALHESPPESRRSNELIPSQVGRGFAPQVGMSTPMVVEAGNRPAALPVSEEVERAQAYDALQARNKTLAR